MEGNTITYKVFLTSSDEKSEIRYITIDPDAKEDFKCLQKKIENNFPALSKKTFDVYWTDAENDKIKISSDDELIFALAKMGDLKKFYVVETVILDKDSLKEGKFVTRKRDSGGLYIHTKIVCGACKGKVYGYRYKCIGCPNYDLCQTCEGNNVHPNHLMLRLPMPIEAVEFDCVVHHVGNWVNTYFSKTPQPNYLNKTYIQRPVQYYKKNEKVVHSNHSEGCKAAKKGDDKDVINKIKQSFLSNQDEYYKTTFYNGPLYQVRSNAVLIPPEMNRNNNVSVNQTKQKLQDVIEDIMVTLLYTEGSSASSYIHIVKQFIDEFLKCIDMKADKDKKSQDTEELTAPRTAMTWNGQYLSALNEHKNSLIMNVQPQQQEPPKDAYRRKPIVNGYFPPELWKMAGQHFVIDPENNGSAHDPSTFKKPMPPHVVEAMEHFRNMGYKNKDGLLEAMIERHNGNINEVLDIIAASDD